MIFSKRPDGEVHENEVRRRFLGGRLVAFQRHLAAQPAGRLRAAPADRIRHLRRRLQGQEDLQGAWPKWPKSGPKPGGHQGDQAGAGRRLRDHPAGDPDDEGL